MPGISISTDARILIDVGDGTAFPTAARLAATGHPPRSCAEGVALQRLTNCREAVDEVARVLAGQV